MLRIVQAAVIKGGARLLVNAPPRHGKTRGISHWFPTWFLDWFPELSVILTSYNDQYAAGIGGGVRDEFKKPETWTRVRHDKHLASDWKTLQGGGMRSSGIGGSLTGFGANLIIVDDPHKNWEEAMSSAKRQRVIDWFNSTLYTRAEPGASIIVVQTRWHENDLTGYLINEHPDDWTLIRLPAISEGEDFLGRPKGAALCPERFTVEDLERIKAGGSFLFAGLYQQRPAPMEGGIIKRDWFQYWKELPNFDQLIQSWDMSFDKKAGSSYVAGQVWGRAAGAFYLVDQIRERLNFVETIRAIERLTSRWPAALEKVIEEKANGPAVIAALRDKVPGIIPWPPKGEPMGSKEARLVAVSGLFEAGNIWIPNPDRAPWVVDYVEELITFPNSAKNDQVDATSQALGKMSRASYDFNISIPTTGTRANPWGEINARN
ncbi:MAG: phage terminase large subunit [Nitrospinaceae bacterium]|nr:phage terminase large subunit [Nitrospinaceae bacterium]